MMALADWSMQRVGSNQCFMGEDGLRRCAVSLVVRYLLSRERLRANTFQDKGPYSEGKTSQGTGAWPEAGKREGM
jgi:hypothetical protein